MRYLIVSITAVAVLLLGPLAVIAAVTYTAAITAQNASGDTFTGQVFSLSPITGDGLDDYTSELRRVSITDNTGSGALWEASGPSETRPWRLVVPSIGPNSGQQYTLRIDSSDQVDAFGCACWSYADHNASTQAPGANPLDLSATVIVKPDTYSESTDLGDSVANQYSSSRRMAFVDGYWYMAAVEGQNIRVYYSDDGVSWTGQTADTLSSPSVPKTVAITYSSASTTYYVHFAYYAADATNDEQEAYYIRGTQGGDGSLTFGSRQTVEVQLLDAAGAPPAHGISITTSGTDFPTIVMPYAEWDGAFWDYRVSYVRSTTSDNWGAPVDAQFTVYGNQGDEEPIYVELAPRGSSIFLATKHTGNALNLYRVDSTGAVTDNVTVDAATTAAQFSLVSDGSLNAYILYNYSGNDVLSASWDGSGALTGTGTVLAAASGQYYPSLTYFAQYLTAEETVSLVAYYLTPTGGVDRTYALIATPNTWVALPDITSGHAVSWISSAATVPALSGGNPNIDGEALAFVEVASTFNVTGAKVPARGHAFLWKPGAYGLMVDQDLTAYAWTVTGGTDEATFTTTAGTHVLRLTYDGAELNIYEDGDEEDSVAATGSVDAATTDVTVSYGFPIVQDASLSINAVETLRWFDALATDATAPAGFSSVDIASATTAYVQAFHATEGEADLTISIGALTPVTVAAASSLITEPTPTITIPTPVAPGGLYDEDGNLTFPGGAIIEDATGGDSAILVFVTGILGALVVTSGSLGIARLTRSPLITALVTLVLLWGFALMSPMPNWLPFLAIPFMFFIWRLQRQSNF